MSRYAEDQIPICTPCSEQSEQEAYIKTCDRCGIAYCVHFASNTDVRMCGNCLDDFRVIETIEVKTTERVDDSGEVISRRRQIARNLKLTGTDWLFCAAKISTLSDEQMDASIEYHRAIKNTLMEEREARRVEYFRKLHNVKTNLSAIDKHLRDKKIDQGIQDGKQKKVNEKIAEKKVDKGLNDIASLLSQVSGTKLDSTQVAALLANLKGAK
jgi:hypothetical protein